jgi:hypothetical protein
MPTLLERRNSWPAELHAAATAYEQAMAQVMTLPKKGDDRRREVFIEDIKRVRFARDYFLMLRKQHESGSCSTGKSGGHGTTLRG